MKKALQKRFVFVAKSMLWSMLLYIVLMLAFNWDDVSNKVKGTNPITVISGIPAQQVPVTNNPAVIPASIAHNVSILKKIVSVVHSISGIVTIPFKK